MMHCFGVGRYSFEHAAFQGVALGCGLWGLLNCFLGFWVLSFAGFCILGAASRSHEELVSESMRSFF